LANQVKNASLDISALETPQSTKPEPMKLIDAYVGQPINILVSGVDSRYTQSSDYGDAEELTTIQSDTTMIAHISADRSEVTFVSIPRDLLT
ncbi:LytR family transcriptional regulator, partial [Actinotignum timonense]|nr:LytR family transcriptional regulator [Actinotignum timonense]